MGRRFHAVARVAARLFREGKAVFSPILHCHELARLNKMPTDAAFWDYYNTGMLTKCDELYVLRLSGWENSVGVTQEIGRASRLFMSITYIDP